jgi:hypothetical protein
MREVADFVNESIKRAERINKIVQIQSSIANMEVGQLLFLISIFQFRERIFT